MNTPWTSGWQRWAGSGLTTADDPPTAISKNLPANMIPTEGARGIRMRVFGDTSNDDCDITIYHVDRSDQDKGIYFSLPFVAVDTVVIGDGTAKGVESQRLLTESEYLADAYTTLAITTYGTRLLQYMNGVCNVFSPGSEGVGELFISDLGNAHGVVPVFDTLNTGNYFGLIFKLDI